MKSIDELKHKLLNAFEEELKENSWVDDSDMIERFIDNKAKEIIAEENGLKCDDDDMLSFEEEIDDLIGEAKSLINSKHKQASINLTDKTYFLYYTDKKSIEDFLSCINYGDDEIAEIMENNIKYY